LSTDLLQTLADCPKVRSHSIYNPVQGQGTRRLSFHLIPPLGPLSSTGRPRLNPDHSSLGVGRQSAFRLVQQDKFVAKGIANARAPADHNVERTLNALAACAQETRESLVDIGDQNVRLGSDLQVNDQLGVGLWKGEASRFIASPQQAMTELVAIKGDRRVKIGDAKQMIVEFLKQGPFSAHVKEP
jgi:hypothetical protein